MSSSWKLESSQTIHASSARAPSSPVSGRPTFPATATGRSAARKIAPSSSLVVVFPFVPVTPSTGLGSSREPSSTSLQIVSPRRRAAATRGASLGTPGLFTSRSTSSTSAGSSAPSTTSTPAARSLPASSSAFRSTPTTRRLRRASASAAASPERARPRTSADSGSELRRVPVVQDEAAGAEDRRDDPEADGDAGLRPRLHLEVVGERGHEENAPAEPLDAADLHDDRERLDHEAAAEPAGEQLGRRHDREGRERPAEAHGAGVAHEDLRGERVVPEEADRSPDQARAQDREVEVDLVRSADGSNRRERGDKAHRCVGEDRDRRRARGEPVDPVREVYAVRGARDDDEEEDVPAPGERQVDVQERDVHVGRERVVEAARGDEGDDRRDQCEPDELPATGEAERAPAGDLGPVVDEADRRAAERDEERGDGRHGPLGEEQERDRHRDHDQEAPHSRRPLLHDVALRSLLADLLAELVLAQEVDELWAGQDGNNHRQHAREQKLDHGRSISTRRGG